MLKHIAEQQRLIKSNIASQFVSTDSSKKKCCAIALFNDKQEILLLKRNSQDGFHPSTWCLPGGGIDFGEKPVDALKREVQEEIGVSEECYYVYTNSVVKLPDVEIHYFVGNLEKDSMPFITLNEAEHVQYRWCKTDEWMCMNLILDLKKHLCKMLSINESQIPVLTDDELDDMMEKGEIDSIEFVEHTQESDFILKSIGIDNKILAVVAVKDDLQKGGGEGSRGGKIIGHTKSGKPIYGTHVTNYDSSNWKEEMKHIENTTKDYTDEDHEDAAKLHSDLSYERKTFNKVYPEHKTLGVRHVKNGISTRVQDHIKDSSERIARMHWGKASDVQVEKYKKEHGNNGVDENYEAFMKYSKEGKGTHAKLELKKEDFDYIIPDRVLPDGRKHYLVKTKKPLNWTGSTRNHESYKMWEELKKGFADDLQKGVAATIGEVRTWDGKRYKKQANGKWMQVSEHGMTKEEHADKATKLYPKGTITSKNFHKKASSDKHREQASKLDSKQYDETELNSKTGSGRHKLLVDAHNQAKGILENFNKNKPTDYQGKINHVSAENRVAETRKKLREHIEEHYNQHGELLDSGDHDLNQKMKDKYMSKSTTDDLQKGHSFPIGTIHNGYKKVKDGVWKKVSGEGKTRAEHLRLQEQAIDAQSQHQSTRNHAQVKWWGEESVKHMISAKDLDDKDYDDVHVLGDKEKDKS